MDSIEIPRAVLEGLIEQLDALKEQVLSLMDTELDEIFADSVKDPLQIGLELGEEITLTSVSKGGYMTNREIVEQNKKFKKFRKLTPDEQDAIMDNFQQVKDMPLIRAQDIIARTGYELHVLKINGENFPRRFNYSAKVIGVSVIDPDFDAKKREVSDEAVVSSIINVGADRYTKIIQQE